MIHPHAGHLAIQAQNLELQSSGNIGEETLDPPAGVDAQTNPGVDAILPSAASLAPSARFSTPLAAPAGSRGQQTRSSLLELPNEVLLQVLRFLDVCDVLSVSRVRF
jgi:hypothetical protein